MSGQCHSCDEQGAELPGSLRSRMERAFGAAIPADVRVHDDAAAHATAVGQGARAFTVGHDIGVRAGTYPPSSPVEEAVLAHELAHTMQFAGPSGPASGGHEADADRMAGSVVARLAGVRTPAPAPPRATSGLALHRCDPRPGQGLHDALGWYTRGVGFFPQHKEYTLDQYIKLWEAQMDRKMTDEERETLATGCIGITAKNLGGTPPTDDCYDSFEHAKARADELDKQGARPFIFSKRFWAQGRAFPVGAGGKVDMTNDVGPDPEGKTNFDYGWYDEEADTWWHANHCDPVTGGAGCRKEYKDERMKVYQSTLDYYSSGASFGADTQVFCVAHSTPVTLR